jgi:hypothetical protein
VLFGQGSDIKPIDGEPQPESAVFGLGDHGSQLAALMRAGAERLGIHRTLPAPESPLLHRQATPLLVPSNGQGSPEPLRRLPLQDAGQYNESEPPRVCRRLQFAKPSQFVTLHNTGEQTHFIIDRYNQGHEFLGGQKKQIEMTTDGIDTLRHLARTDRGIYRSGQKKGQPFPPHPVRIIDVGPIRCNGIELPAAPSEPERPKIEA